MIQSKISGDLALKGGDDFLPREELAKRCYKQVSEKVQFFLGIADKFSVIFAKGSACSKILELAAMQNVVWGKVKT